jgi:hypothetical protein
MEDADDLLEEAHHLVDMEVGQPKQASLRRAVSTFHLLIDEVVGNWGIARQRSTLGRAFDHGKMGPLTLLEPPKEIEDEEFEYRVVHRVKKGKTTFTEAQF